MPRRRKDDRADVKRNAGISLSDREIEKLANYAKSAKLDGVSAVVSLLIEKGLPTLWWELELSKRGGNGGNS